MIERIPFGNTGHTSTRALFGAAALFDGNASDADRVLDLLLAHGINHIDTAADYGKSEELLGRWIGRHRNQFFLATKTAARDAAGARDSIARSLERMHVDSVDLLQLHCLVEEDEWEQAMRSGGALEAAIEAQEQGLTRFIGVTGHGLQAPAMHLRSLQRFDFDSILVPLNFPLLQIPEYAESFEGLHRECSRRGIPLQTIKAIARRRWPDDAHWATTWYEPLSEQADIDLAVHWVLDRPNVFLSTAADCTLLPKVLDAAERHEMGSGPTDQRMADLAERLAMQPVFP